MSAGMKIGLAAVLCVGIVASTDTASAITADVARKCDGLLSKAFPPRVVGNPAAGSAKGSFQDEQSFFKKCVENNGKADDQSQGDQDHKDAK